MADWTAVNDNGQEFDLADRDADDLVHEDLTTCEYRWARLAFSQGKLSYKRRLWASLGQHLQHVRTMRDLPANLLPIRLHHLLTAEQVAPRTLTDFRFESLVLLSRRLAYRRRLWNALGQYLRMIRQRGRA